MANIRWIRDFWMLFISNLAPIATEKDLYGHFREAGLVFDVFIPRNKHSGDSRGFGFVRYKIEWDVKKAINILNVHLIGGRKISVQMANMIPGVIEVLEKR